MDQPRPPQVGLTRLGPSRAAREAARALTVFAREKRGNCEAIREAGGIVPLVALLSKPDIRQAALLEKAEQGFSIDSWIENAGCAAQALSNIMHDSDAAQLAVLEADAIPPLISLLSHGLLAPGPSSRAAGAAASALAALARTRGSEDPTGKRCQRIMRERGAIESLVMLLTSVPAGQTTTAVKATSALKHLAFACKPNREAIREAGGIAPLVALLATPGHSDDDVMIITGALWNLGYNNSENQDAIREASGLRVLSTLLSSTEATAGSVPNICGCLRNLCHGNEANKDEVRESGGIARLVEIADEPEADDSPPSAIIKAAATKAAEALEVLVEASPVNTRSVISALMERRDEQTPRALFPHAAALRTTLQASVELALDMAVERASADPSGYGWALKEATALGLSEISAARQRAEAVCKQAREEREHRERREALGIPNLTTPNDFLCPITHDVMVDPVVASDGHSYERSAIQRVLDLSAESGGTPVSPLTRMPLQAVLYPNTTLLKRIKDYDSEIEGIAQQVMDSVSHRACAEVEGKEDGCRARKVEVLFASRQTSTTDLLLPPPATRSNSSPIVGKPSVGTQPLALPMPSMAFSGNKEGK
jgi:hypothetical protein